MLTYARPRDDEPRTSFFRFGIPYVLKRTPRTVSTEADALRYLNRVAPHLPIPKLIDSFKVDGATYTLMTQLPGRRLLDVAELEPSELITVTQDILSILNELWRLPQPSSCAGQVMMSASGHGLPHPATLYEALGGPYASTVECYNSMIMQKSGMAAHPPEMSKALADDPVVWVHTDLRMQNILVENGRVTGVVDWEDAGWLPKHWQLHSLRLPCWGAQGAWVRFWINDFVFDEITEVAYRTSLAPGVLLYPL
ncbi:kinase-like domain-containing protein [Amylostereum chailletii]|nr:kinase-like domain-containing protein [Amylostereum chailletii]